MAESSYAERKGWIHDAIQRAANDNEHIDVGVVSKWVVVAEIITEDGKTLYSATSDDIASWDVVGLMEYRIHAEWEGIDD